VNLPDRWVEQQRSPAEPETNITELRPIAERTSRVGAEFRAEAASVSQEQSTPNSAFWSELNSTLDEFFTVIGQSRDRIAELSTEVAKRDGIITLLEAQNIALKARLGIADNAPAARAVGSGPRVQEPIAPPPQTNSASTEPRKDRGIWGKLTNLERDA
jgi:hypothetical protein